MPLNTPFRNPNSHKLTEQVTRDDTLIHVAASYIVTKGLERHRRYYLAASLRTLTPVAPGAMNPQEIQDDPLNISRVKHISSLKNDTPG